MAKKKKTETTSEKRQFDVNGGWREVAIALTTRQNEQERAA